MSHKPIIYNARLLTDNAMKKMQENSHYTVITGDEAPPSREELLRNVAGADAAIVTLTEKIDKEFFDAAGEQLKIVANVAVGFDNIDLEEAKKRGVIITNTPRVLDDATADYTCALILALTRRLVEADRFARSGQSWIWGPRSFVGLDMNAHPTLAIIGCGRIGQAVAQRAQAFGMKIIAVDQGVKPGECINDIPVVTLEEALEKSDIISLHVPLTADTYHMFDRHVLRNMKEGSYLINAARGGVVDEEALIELLQNGHIAGAAIDTFENEPHINEKFADLENVIITPHIASAGDKTRDDMCYLAINNVMSVVEGKEPITPVKL